MGNSSCLHYFNQSSLNFFSSSVGLKIIGLWKVVWTLLRVKRRLSVYITHTKQKKFQLKRVVKHRMKWSPITFKICSINPVYAVTCCLSIKSKLFSDMWRAYESSQICFTIVQVTFHIDPTLRNSSPVTLNILVKHLLATPNIWCRLTRNRSSLCIRATSRLLRLHSIIQTCRGDHLVSPSNSRCNWAGFIAYLL